MDKHTIKKSYARNQIVINEIKEKIECIESLVIFGYKGLTVSELESLRKILSAQGSEIKIFKNTMVNRAVEEGQYKNLQNYLNNANAFIFNYTDGLSPLKDIANFAKKHSKLEIKGGIFDNNVVDANTIKALSSLPNKNGLISMFLSCLQAPVRNLAYALDQVALAKQNKLIKLDTILKEVYE